VSIVSVEFDGVDGPGLRSKNIDPMTIKAMASTMPTTMPFIFFFDKDSVSFSYELLDNKIASQSPGNEIKNLYLTNDKVKVSNLKFTCYRTSIFSPPVVYTSFDVVRSNELNPTPLQYSTKFQLRNY